MNSLYWLRFAESIILDDIHTPEARRRFISSFVCVSKDCDKGITFQNRPFDNISNQYKYQRKNIETDFSNNPNKYRRPTTEEMALLIEVVVSTDFYTTRSNPDDRGILKELNEMRHRLSGRNT